MLYGYLLIEYEKKRCQKEGGSREKNFVAHEDVSPAVHEPVKTAIPVVPHAIDEKIETVLCKFFAHAALAGTKGVRKGVKHTRLGDEALFILTAIVSVPVEMGD